MKQYRLLRNNKESGPHSADELIRMTLKAYDLIWVEGKSAAWRYPCEIDELKSHAPAVEEQPFDRFYKRPVAQTVVKEENKPVSQKQSATIVTTKEKPRIRVSATWNRIEPVAAVEKKSPQPVQKPATNEMNIDRPPSWQDSWLDWEKEKKAVTSSKFSDPTPSSNKPPVMQTKFSQSLDEIKERYAETILKARSNSLNIGQYKNFAITAFLIVAVSGLGYALWHEWNSKNETANVLLTVPKADNNKKNIQQAEQTEANIPESQPEENTDSKTYIVPVKEKNPPADNAQTSKTETLKSQPVRSSVNEQKNLQSNNNTKSKNSTLPGNNKSLVKQPVPPTAGASTSTQQNTPSTVKNVPEKSSKISPIFNAISKSEHVQDFVAVDPYNPSSSAGVENLSFHVQNVSDIPLDLVVMDLQYFSTDGKYRKGETVYMKNIAAGKTITINAPDDKLSAKVTYKVSLVSAPEKDIYLIAD